MPTVKLYRAQWLSHLHNGVWFRGSILGTHIKHQMQKSELCLICPGQCPNFSHSSLPLMNEWHIFLWNSAQLWLRGNSLSRLQAAVPLALPLDNAAGSCTSKLHCPRCAWLACNMTVRYPFLLCLGSAFESGWIRKHWVSGGGQDHGVLKELGIVRRSS